MPDTTTDARQVATFVVRNEHSIVNAMQVYARHMRDSAELARREFEAGQADPAVKAAQDASLVTNAGYRMAAEMAEESAATATRVCDGLRELLDDYDEDEDGF